MKYRSHRGGLAESMATMVELADRTALVEHLRREWQPFHIAVDDADVTVTPFGFDRRIDWDTHLVSLRGQVVGMTDGTVA